MRTIRERCRESRATERRGVATVEFALVSMLFFLFLGGIVHELGAGQVGLGFLEGRHGVR